jgi:hypothetical protein
MENEVIHIDGDIFFHEGSEMSFFTASNSLRGGRLGPTSTEKTDTISGGGNVASWGTNNDRPQKVVEEMEQSDLLRPLIRKQAKRLIGGGLAYGFDVVDERTGKEGRKALRIPEIDRTLRRTNSALYDYEAWNDWGAQGNVFAELQTDHDGNIVGLYCQDATRCRLSRKDDSGRIRNCYIGGNWPGGDDEKAKGVFKLPALDPYYDVAGQIQESNAARFILPIRLLVDNNDYYGQAPWHGLIDGGY